MSNSNKNYDKVSEEHFEKYASKLARDAMMGNMYMMRCTHDEETIIKILTEEIEYLYQCIQDRDICE